MCDRYTNTRISPEDIAARFEITISIRPPNARSAARTSLPRSRRSVVGGKDGERRAILARFGLAPPTEFSGEGVQTRA
jgi:putative SOS response-associated peptidase YedK